MLTCRDVKLTALASHPGTATATLGTLAAYIELEFPQSEHGDADNCEFS